MCGGQINEQSVDSLLGDMWVAGNWLAENPKSSSVLKLAIGKLVKLGFIYVTVSDFYYYCKF